MAVEPDVLVVGGGIGGIGASYALARQGVGVRVLERASEFREVGAGIQLAPNCTRILDDYGLLDEARDRGVLPNSMVMRDAVDGTELTRLDLRGVEQRYGYPYLVIHRSDLHDLLLRAAQRVGVDLVTDATVVAYEPSARSAAVVLADGSRESAATVIAADGLHSLAREALVGDNLVSAGYVAYRGTVPVSEPRAASADVSEVCVHVGPRCHFVTYGLRGGELLNQVAVFESRKALDGVDDWGTPDELEEAFLNTTPFVREALSNLWRERWWRMFDRDPITSWVYDRVALLGDAAHPPLQYIAQGAIMAIEDGWVLGEHVSRQLAQHATVNWDDVLAAYDAVRPEHCRRVVSASRAWGKLWHLDGQDRDSRNDFLRVRDTYDYSFVDWLYSPTAVLPADESPEFTPVSLA